MGDLSATSQSMACCWFQWCRTPKPLPYAVTQDRAVLYVYTMGCPGFRLGINKFDRHKVCCCCSPSDPSPSQPAEVPTQLADVLTSAEFEAIVDDVQEVHVDKGRTVRGHGGTAIARLTVAVSR